MESIYIQTKMRGQGSLELALEIKKTKGLTFYNFFTHLVQICICMTVFMKFLDLIDICRYSAQDHEYEVRNLKSLSALSFQSFVCVCVCPRHPTYRVCRLYTLTIMVCRKWMLIHVQACG